VALSLRQLEQLWIQAGGSRGRAKLAASVAAAESSGNPSARSHNPVSGGSNLGLWQIDSGSHNNATTDPLGNARAAVQISKDGRDWSQWETYVKGLNRPFLAKAPSARGLSGQVSIPGAGRALGADPAGGFSATPGGTGQADILQQLLSARPQVQVTAPTPPASVTRYLHDPRPAVGGSPSAPPAQTQSTQDLLAAAAGLRGPTLPQAQAGGTGGTQAGAPAGGARGGVGYPLGRRGKIIGTPYQGTHTLGDWESDNAVDIAVPKGTPVYAVSDGTIGSQIGSLGKGGQFAGLRLHLQTGDNEYYYAHLSKLAVRAGQRVRAGDLLGYSGEANGVQHLHIGEKRGNPQRRFG
jgi:hypothetical protein